MFVENNLSFLWLDNLIMNLTWWSNLSQRGSKSNNIWWKRERKYQFVTPINWAIKFHVLLRCKHNYVIPGNFKNKCINLQLLLRSRQFRKRIWRNGLDLNIIWSTPFSSYFPSHQVRLLYFNSSFCSFASFCFCLSLSISLLGFINLNVFLQGKGNWTTVVFNLKLWGKPGRKFIAFLS